MIIGKESSSPELDAENSSPETLGLVMTRSVSYLSACVLIIFHVRFYQNANTTHKINIMRFFAFVFFSYYWEERREGEVEALSGQGWKYPFSERGMDMDMDILIYETKYGIFLYCSLCLVFLTNLISRILDVTPFFAASFASISPDGVRMVLLLCGPEGHSLSQCQVDELINFQDCRKHP